MTRELDRLEALAFDKRIDERVKNNFVPDIGNLKFNPQFYKSFWRYPMSADLYVGYMSRKYLELIDKYAQGAKSILDVGCGAGYFSFQLARNGYDVIGIDISKRCIEVAQNYSAQISDDFSGTVSFHNLGYHELSRFGKFDVILSSGFLHHLPKIDEAVLCLKNILSETGVVLLHEPQHSKFSRSDASIVGILRMIMSASGSWYEKDVWCVEIEDYIDSVLQEYTLERDADEVGGQSPNDLSQDFDSIVRSLKAAGLTILFEAPSKAFTYRFLGGVRIEQTEKLEKVMLLLDKLDCLLVSNYGMNANYSFAVFQKGGKL